MNTSSTIAAIKTTNTLNHNKDLARYAVWQAVGQTYAIAKGIPDSWFLETSVFSFTDSGKKQVHWSVVGQDVLGCIARGEDFAEVYKIDQQCR